MTSSQPLPRCPHPSVLTHSQPKRLQTKKAAKARPAFLLIAFHLLKHITQYNKTAHRNSEGDKHYNIYLLSVLFKLEKICRRGKSSRKNSPLRVRRSCGAFAHQQRSRVNDQTQEREQQKLQFKTMNVVKVTSHKDSG